MRASLRSLLLIAMLLTLACKGADGAAGPTGPQGPAGPQGPPGPAGAAGAVNRADGSGIFGSSGTATLLLPAGATAGGKVPAIACYTSSNAQTWLAVAHSPSSTGITYCGLTGIGTSTPGITFVSGIPGWYYYAVAVW